jgi:hypothetical protein
MLNIESFMKKYNFLFLIIFIFSFSACSKVDNRYAEIERDGEVYSVYWDDLNESIKKVSDLEFVYNDLNKEYYYDDGSHLEKDMKYVDNSIYDFLIVVPVKSKIDLENKFKGHGDFAGYYTDYVNVQYTNGYYHYKLYINSNFQASFFFLNDVKDQQMYIEYHYNDYGEQTHYTSNKLTIPAEEFEEMLDCLGISHERLEFQPDDR